MFNSTLVTTYKEGKRVSQCPFGLERKGKIEVGADGVGASL